MRQWDGHACTKTESRSGFAYLVRCTTRRALMSVLGRSTRSSRSCSRTSSLSPASEATHRSIGPLQALMAREPSALVRQHLAELVALLAFQDDHCAVCNAVALVLDHDHESGLVRGYLCLSHNTHESAPEMAPYLTDPPARRMGLEMTYAAAIAARQRYRDWERERRGLPRSGNRGRPRIYESRYSTPLRLERPVAERVRRYRAENGLTLNQLLLMALTEYLDIHESDPATP